MERQPGGHLAAAHGVSTDWEAQYRQQDTPWEKGAPAPPLLEWLEAGNALTGDILVPGCGYGHDVRALAAQAAGPRVVGLDLAPSALAGARAFAPVGREEYCEGDLFALPEEMRGSFDAVFEHTCFCAIDPARRADYVAAVAGALRPAGRLLAVFYLDPYDPGEDRKGGPPFGVETAELDALFDPYFERLEQRRPARAYRGREGRELLRLLRRR